MAEFIGLVRYFDAVKGIMVEPKEAFVSEAGARSYREAGELTKIALKARRVVAQMRKEVQHG